MAAAAPDRAGDDGARAELAVNPGDAVLAQVQDGCLAEGSDALPPLRRVVSLAGTPVGEGDPVLAWPQATGREAVAPVARCPDALAALAVGGAVNHEGAHAGEWMPRGRAHHAGKLWALPAPGIGRSQAAQSRAGCQADGHLAGRHQRDGPQDGRLAWCDQHDRAAGQGRGAAVELVEVAGRPTAVAVPEPISTGPQASDQVPAAGRGSGQSAAALATGDDAGAVQSALTGAQDQASH